MGPGKIANFETLGYVDLRGSDYFVHGTHMHLSHIQEDLEAWYLNFQFDERVATAFRPNLKVQQDTQAVARGRRRPRPAPTSAASTRVRADRAQCVDPDDLAARPRRPRGGRRLSEGDGDPVRADFNTLDNPFFWSRAARGDRRAARGRHALRLFNPTGDDFRRNRLAMDGQCPGEDPAPPARPRTGVQLDPLDDPPAELPRAAASQPQLPARRALIEPNLVAATPSGTRFLRPVHLDRIRFAL